MEQHIETMNEQVQWKKDFYKQCCMNGLYGFDGLDYYSEEETVKSFISSTLKELVTTIVEKKTNEIYFKDEKSHTVISIEDIINVAKEYGVDIGGKGE